MSASYTFLRPKHLPAVMELEQKSFTVPDPDFDVPTLSELAWSCEKYIEVLEESGTQGWCIVEGKDDNEVLVGVLVYEFEAKAILVRRLLIHPDYRLSGFARAAMERIYAKVVKNPKLQYVRFLVDERQPAMSRFMQKLEFSLKGTRDGCIEWEYDVRAAEKAATQAA